jgi:glycine cleavage system aminomethyltransferase T
MHGSTTDSSSPLLRSGAHDRRSGIGFDAMEEGGWELAAAYAPHQADQADHGPNSLDERVAREVIACRAAVVMVDESSAGAFRISGSDAVRGLAAICTADIDREVGAIVYTALCNDEGGVEADVTVTRLADDEFHVITDTGGRLSDLAWITKGIETARPGGDIEIADVTQRYGCVAVWGPFARQVLSPITTAQLGTHSFPYLTAQTIEVAGIEVLALRVSYAGELGWELHTEQAALGELWDACAQAGAPYGVRPAGALAVDAMRMEKAYRARGWELLPDTTPYEAGLGFTVALNAPGRTDFIGRNALLAASQTRPTLKLVQIELDDAVALCDGGELVLDKRNAPIGTVTSGAFGSWVQRSLAFAYVPVDVAVDGARVRVDVNDTLVPGSVRCGALHDPTGSRLRA